MYGLVDIQRNLDDNAKKGIQHAAGLEKNRKQANDQMKAQKQINKKNSIAQGAGTGAAIGMAAGNPVAGAVIGAGVGYLTHKFF